MRQKTLLAAAGVLAAITTTILANPAHAAAPVCTDETITIDITTGTETIAGTYCRPVGADPGDVTIAVPGGTYTRWYWDSDYEPERYSFARNAAAAGHPVWAIDRLGTGESSRPPSLALTTTVHAEAIGAVADQVRAGALDGHPAEHVYVAGHSMGSATAILAAADGANVDGLILTGLTPMPRLDGLARLTTHLRPAGLDPATDDYGADLGYVTTDPGSRPGLFYFDDGADSDLIARDEEVKTALSLNEFPDALARVALLNAARQITVPVLTIMGANDTLFCGNGATDCDSTLDLVAQQTPQFAGAACYSAAVLPATGHDIALHRTAARSQTLMTTWLDAAAAGTCPTGDAETALVG